VPTFDRVTHADGLSPGTGYAHAVVTLGRTAFVSGQVAVDAEGAVVGTGDIAAQTRQALANLGRVLDSLDAGWRDVAKLGWYVVDVTQLPTIRNVRDEVLRPALDELPNPASTLVQVVALARPEFLVEVDAVVALPS
jgi:enamine deaminase RidA (YjgF/YER057c/UK114 family)